MKVKNEFTVAVKSDEKERTMDCRFFKTKLSETEIVSLN